MLIVTRWIDEKNTDFAEIEKMLLAEHPDDVSENSAKYLNWKIVKVFPDNKEIVLNGRKVIFNYYTYSVDQIPGGVEDSGDGTYTKTGFLIPYNSSGRIRYIINKNTYAQTFLRKMLFYKGKGEIKSNPADFTGDIFVWLISKVYSCEDILQSESDSLENVCIESIKGFKGNTEDLLAKVTMSGESVMNIISALSFLIERQNLNQITIDLSYRNHTNIEVTLNNKNTIGFADEKYLGELNQAQREEICAVCFLTLYSEIIPIILQKYQSDVDTNMWGQGKCVEFLERIAADLSGKIKARIDDLNSRPEQLKIRFNLADNTDEC